MEKVKTITFDYSKDENVQKCCKRMVCAQTHMNAAKKSRFVGAKEYARLIFACHRETLCVIDAIMSKLDREGVAVSSMDFNNNGCGTATLLTDKEERVMMSPKTKELYYERVRADAIATALMEKPFHFFQRKNIARAFSECAEATIRMLNSISEQTANDGRKPFTSIAGFYILFSSERIS